MPQASKCKPDRNRKSGNNIRYKAENRDAKSHVRRIKKHLTRYGQDRTAIDALLRFSESAGSNALNSAKEFVKTI